MPNCLMSKELFDKHKKRAWSQLRDPSEPIDVELRPLLEQLNKLPYLATLFSCAGHNKGGAWSVFYITWVIDPEQHELVERLLTNAFIEELLANDSGKAPTFQYSPTIVHNRDGVDATKSLGYRLECPGQHGRHYRDAVVQMIKYVELKLKQEECR